LCIVHLKTIVSTIVRKCGTVLITNQILIFMLRISIIQHAPKIEMHSWHFVLQNACCTAYNFAVPVGSTPWRLILSPWNTMLPTYTGDYWETRHFGANNIGMHTVARIRNIIIHNTVWWRTSYIQSQAMCARVHWDCPSLKTEIAFLRESQLNGVKLQFNFRHTFRRVRWPCEGRIYPCVENSGRDIPIGRIHGAMVYSDIYTEARICTLATGRTRRNSLEI